MGRILSRVGAGCLYELRKDWKAAMELLKRFLAVCFDNARDSYSADLL
jgi:hypothetical protein